MGLKNYQFNTLIQKYEERQNINRDIVDSRRENICKLLPEYRELERAVIDATIECTPLAISKKTEEAMKELQKLKTRIAELSEKKKKLLVKNGYPENYLDPIFTCPDCKDTGYINGMKCHCFRQAVVDLLYTQSNVKEFIKTENFRNFSFDYYSKDDIDSVTGESSYDIMTYNYNAAKEFVDKFEPGKQNLFFYGNAGLGKTFLSNCIANELLKKGHTVLYLTATRLFDAIGKSIRNEEDEENISETQEYIMGCDLLIIDDLGAELSTAFTISQLNNVINERLLSGKSTIISSNLGPGEIREAYGERNFSRIIGSYKMLHFYGIDIRLAKSIRKRNSNLIDK